MLRPSRLHFDVNERLNARLQHCIAWCGLTLSRRPQAKFPKLISTEANAGRLGKLANVLPSSSTRTRRHQIDLHKHIWGHRLCQRYSQGVRVLRHRKSLGGKRPERRIVNTPSRANGD